MKIAISTESQQITGSVDTRFGRAKGFIIFDTETGDYNYIDNTQNLESAQGAGVQSAKVVINTGAGVLLTGNVGPKAFSALKRAGIEVYIGAKGSIKDAIDDYKQGKLQKADGANVESHW